MKLLNEMVAELANDRVGYYWEYDVNNFPVFETFLFTDEKQIVELKNKLESEIRNEASVSLSKASIDMEKLNHLEDYYRLMVVMDFKEMKKAEILRITRILESYGEPKWEE